MRRLGFGLIAVLTASLAAAEDADWKQRLEEAIARAIAQNPSIAEMDTRVRAAGHRAGQALALPDPEVEVEIQDIPPSDFSFSRDDFTMERSPRGRGFLPRASALRRSDRPRRSSSRCRPCTRITSSGWRRR